jgi:Protein of unknown function, DUF255
MSVKRKVTVPLGRELTGQSMSVNRLAEETSPYLLQHADNPVASASLAMPTSRGRAGFAGTTVFV